MTGTRPRVAISPVSSRMAPPSSRATSVSAGVSSASTPSSAMRFGFWSGWRSRQIVSTRARSRGGIAPVSSEREPPNGIGAATWSRRPRARKRKSEASRPVPSAETPRRRSPRGTRAGSGRRGPERSPVLARAELGRRRVTEVEDVREDHAARVLGRGAVRQEGHAAFVDQADLVREHGDPVRAARGDVAERNRLAGVVDPEVAADGEPLARAHHEGAAARAAEGQVARALTDRRDR